MSQQALLLVDLQNDFCCGGTLAVPQADQTIAVANRLIDAFQRAGKPIIASQDWHPAHHGSFASQHHCAPFSQGVLHGLAQTYWPDHCIQHSQGAALHPQLAVEAIQHIIRKGQDPRFDSYSAFFDNGHQQQTDLQPLLSQQGVTGLTIMGLATDYCVKFTVLDALQLGYSVTLIRDGCRGVNLQPDDSQQALAEMHTAGARLCSLAEWFAQGGM